MRVALAWLLLVLASQLWPQEHTARAAVAADAEWSSHRSFVDASPATTRRPVLDEAVDLDEDDDPSGTHSRKSSRISQLRGRSGPRLARTARSHTSRLYVRHRALLR